jgi:hypothetical protein
MLMVVLDDKENSHGGGRAEPLAQDCTSTKTKDAWVGSKQVRDCKEAVGHRAAFSSSREIGLLVAIW